MIFINSDKPCLPYRSSRSVVWLSCQKKSSKFNFTLIELLAVPGVAGSSAKAKRLMRFTLIELLVVIGIIALLAAMLLPMLGTSQEQSRKTYCANNLRQIGVALSGYVSENQGRFPTAVRIGIDSSDPDSLPNILEIENREVFKCPSDLNEKYDGKSYFNRYGTCYEWNVWFNDRLIEKDKFNLSGNKLISPLMSDAEDFHNPLNKNHLYPDGHVSRKLENPVE